MKNLRLIWVGRTKDSFIREGVDRYLDLIRPHARIEIIELREAAGPDSGVVRKKEGERILGTTSGFVLLDEAGEEMTSVEFSSFVGSLHGGATRRDIVIGGAFGVSEEVKQAAWRRISLSRMTLTHQMVRLVLLEQIFRAFSIMKGRNYHH